MTLLGLVELSQTPNRAVRGSVLSSALAWPRPGAWEKLGLAATSTAAVKTAVQTSRFRYRIDHSPFERRVLGKTSVSILNATRRCNERSPGPLVAAPEP